jgi:hypothetical protein
MAENAFAPITTNENMFTRKWGTTTGNTVDPFISGYIYVKFKIPDPVFTQIQRTYPGKFTSKVQVENTLASTMQSITIPGRTVNKVENVGLGGIRWSAVGNIDEDTNISMRFDEYQERPLHTIFSGWTKLMRDNRHGASLLNATSLGNAYYTKSNYAGLVYYWNTNPGGRLVEFCACYAGIFPLRDPNDVFSGDIASNDKVSIDMDFSTDYCYNNMDWVRARCQSYAEQYNTNAMAAMVAYSENVL